MALKNNPFAKQRTLPRYSSHREREMELIKKGLLPPIPGHPFYDIRPQKPEPLIGATEESEGTIDRDGIKIEI
jgi:hypothetical protein